MSDQYITNGDTVYFHFASNDTSGSGGDGASAAVDVRECGALASAASITTGVTVSLLSDASYPAGCYEVEIDTTSGYSADKVYAVFCTLAVDSQNPTGFIGRFHTKDVQATLDGELVTLAAVTHTGAVIPTVSTLTGHTAQTGDSYALANGATGFSAIDTVVDAIKAVTDALPNSGALTDLATAAALTTVDNEVGAIQTDVTAVKAKTDSLTFTVANQVDSNMVAISGTTAPADNLEASASVIVTGAAATGTLSTTQMSTDLSEATDDHYNGRIVIWTSGVLTGQATDITDYVGVNGVLTFTAVTEAPSNGDAFVIV